jgi:hypothetical protein
LLVHSFASSPILSRGIVTVVSAPYPRLPTKFLLKQMASAIRLIVGVVLLLIAACHQTAAGNVKTTKLVVVTGVKASSAPGNDPKFRLPVFSNTTFTFVPCCNHCGTVYVPVPPPVLASSPFRCFTIPAPIPHYAAVPTPRSSVSGACMPSPATLHVSTACLSCIRCI